MFYYVNCVYVFENSKRGTETKQREKVFSPLN